MSLSASSQGVVYAVVIIYSLWIGGIDFVIPVKYALLTAMFILLYRPIGDFGLELRKFLAKHPVPVGISSKPIPKPSDPNLQPLGVTSWHAIELLALAAVVAPFIISFVLMPYSNVNLMMLTNDVKIEASLGVLLLAGLGLNQIIRTLKLEGKIMELLRRAKRGTS